MPNTKNVIGTNLVPCSTDPMTGFFRDGCCHTGPEDMGVHIVCTKVTADFLAFSKERGNDLITPNPMYQFPGLKPGDQWCLCVSRWVEAYEEGVAPPVVLESTHVAALEFVDLSKLKEYAC